MKTFQFPFTDAVVANLNPVSISDRMLSSCEITLLHKRKRKLLKS
jgi:hypothetical protein